MHLNFKASCYSKVSTERIFSLKYLKAIFQDQSKHFSTCNLCLKKEAVPVTANEEKKQNTHNYIKKL